MAKSTAKNLVIIESPPKAHTIQACLGSNYKVVASKGHVRDLPKSYFGIDIENNFQPHYINIRGKGDLIKELKKEAKEANKVFLATDPDREGEAISWHLATALDLPPEKTLRVTFNEITKTAVKNAIKAPRQIDMNLVDAQQSRRILDRIVGYKLSPLLWKRVKHGLSAGRVQSVATRLVVEREEEIRAFVPVEYWTIGAKLDPRDGSTPFAVRYFGSAAAKDKGKLTCEADANAVVNDVKGKDMTVLSVKHGVKYKSPAPPFTTSTMQQEASRRLGFQSARIMRTAQELYEGINLGAANGGAQGLITYMRTDSLRVAEEAQDAAREFIAGKYGEQYRPATPRVFKTKAGAQDAHEAIRPSRVSLTPADVKQYLTPDQFKLYRLIWERFVASQMESAKLDTLTVDFECAGHVFRTGGYTVVFQGYMAVYEETQDDAPASADADPDNIKNLRIPALTEGQKLGVTEITPARHFTEAPPRYTEATLIKALEDRGIGRPSTITPTITTIITREYVKRDGKSLVPTQLGEVTTALMRSDFADIVDYKFTANMEDKLDGIENGDTPMISVLNDFWNGFRSELEIAEKKEADEGAETPVEETDLICDKCGARMIVKQGRFGKFAACPNYPQCRNTKPLEGSKTEQEKKPAVIADFKCEICGGDMVQRHGPYGTFYACANYPKCKYIKREETKLDVKCPKCGGDILLRHGRNKSVFYSCSNYPKCDFSSWDMPTNEKCPDCGAMLFRRKGSNPGLVCHNKSCGYTRREEPVPDNAVNDDMPPMPGDGDAPTEF
ncbi:MAG: type I DNA topoisomerase [Clostridia bacterium]|nr:type I DNA topoisomerase [Clostridia bacterium]